MRLMRLGLEIGSTPFTLTMSLATQGEAVPTMISRQVLQDFNILLFAPGVGLSRAQVIHAPVILRTGAARGTKLTRVRI